MKQTPQFDFGRLADGLTIEIQVNPNHRRILRVQMIERFESRQGQRWFRPTQKTVTAIVVGFGLLSVGLVVQQQMGRHSVPTVNTSTLIDRVDAAAAAQDLETVTGYLSVPSIQVQVAVINHLAVLGDRSTIEKLKRLLQQSDSPQVLSAAREAIAAIDRRLQALPPAETDDPGQVLRFKVTDPEGRPLRGAHVRVEPWWSEHPPKERITNAKGKTTLTDVQYSDVIYSVSKKGYRDIRHIHTQDSDRHIQIILWPNRERIPANRRGAMLTLKVSMAPGLGRHAYRE